MQVRSPCRMFGPPSVLAGPGRRAAGRCWMFGRLLPVAERLGVVPRGPALLELGRNLLDAWQVLARRDGVAPCRAREFADAFDVAHQIPNDVRRQYGAPRRHSE